MEIINEKRKKKKRLPWRWTRDNYEKQKVIEGVVEERGQHSCNMCHPRTSRMQAHSHQEKLVSPDLVLIYTNFFIHKD